MFQRFDAANVLSDIYTVTAAGKGLTDVTGTPKIEDRDPAWSADGAHIALRRFGAGADELWVMDADGSGLHVLPYSGAAAAPAWSPDGTRIAYCDLDDDEAWGHIYTINPDGTGRVQVTAGATTDEVPDWRPI
ncbi:TolB family protein [Dactylosporangium matsuzakiense]|uniref:TolB family protein n=1 Tax=Dactylosporangium matsuzakiense TaxID=53360 RepID=UPI0021C4AC09|nr:hypothetical protein [Dactylosporangium matsuzakiense]UWZ41608.1 PD40 domain-containing protein [Dactylosporangium matsuzakiense]